MKLRHEFTEQFKVVIYTRTSTDEQDVSPEIQEAQCRQFCQEAGWEVVGVFNDICSGATRIRDRRQFQRLLAEAPRNGVRGVVALVLDRMLRSTDVKAELQQVLERYGLFSWTVHDGVCLGRPPKGLVVRASDKAIANFNAAASQFYRDSISDKVKDHQLHRVEQGLPHSGNPSFGYRPQEAAFCIEGRHFDGWVPDDTPDGSPDGLTLAQRFAWIVTEFQRTENLMDIAVRLTELGVPTPRLVQWNRLTLSEQERRIEVQEKNRRAGKDTRELPPSPHWDSSVLSDMLRSKTYLGRLKYRGRWYEGRHQPLLSEEVFAQVQAVLDAKGQAKRHPPQRRNNAERLDVLLSGMLRCTCGRALTFQERGAKAYRYVCNMRKKTRGRACQMPGINGKAAEKVAFELLLRGLRVRLSEIRAALPLVIEPSATGELEQELVALHKKRERITECYLDGVFGEGPEARALRDSKLHPVLKRAQEIQDQLAVYHQPKTDELEDAIANIEKRWLLWPTAVKRDVFRTYVPNCFLMLDGRVLRAEVCGVWLEAPVPVQPVATPGMRYGGRQRKDKKEGLTETGQAFRSCSPVSGGNYRSGGI